MSSNSSKVPTQKNAGSENVGSRKKSSSRSTGSVAGKHAEAVTTAVASAGLEGPTKSINSRVGTVPALGHLKPEDLSCVYKPEELVFGLPYIPPVNIPAFESRFEKAAEISGLESTGTVSPPTVNKFIQSDIIFADSMVNETSPITGHSLPGTCHLVSRPTMPLMFTGTVPVLSDSTKHQTDLAPISPRFVPEPSVNKFKLTDDPSFLRQALFVDAGLMLTDERPATSRGLGPTPGLIRQTDDKSSFQDVASSRIKFTLSGTGPTFRGPSLPDTAFVSAIPGSMYTDKPCHDTSYADQSFVDRTETTSAQMPESGVDQSQTTKSPTFLENADSLGLETVAIDQRNIADECLGFKRRSPLRPHSHSCSDCSEEETTLMAKHNFSQDQLAELRESYFYFASPSDQLHQTNFGRSLRAIGQNPSEEDIRKMLMIASVSHEDGCITLDNYLKAVGCWGLMSEVDMIDDLIQAFKVFDDDGDERLDSMKITAALKNYAEPLDEEDANRFLQLADSSPSSDGKLTFLNVVKAFAAHYIARDVKTNASAI